MHVLPTFNSKFVYRFRKPVLKLRVITYSNTETQEQECQDSLLLRQKLTRVPKSFSNLINLTYNSGGTV